MVKTKHRALSVLLTLCLSVVMLAGVMLATSVQVHARVLHDSESLYVGLVFKPGDRIIYRNGHSLDKGSGFFLQIYSYASYEDLENDIGSGHGKASYPGPIDAGISVPTNDDVFYTTLHIAKIDEVLIEEHITLILYLVEGLPPWWVSAPAPDAGTDEYYNRHYDFYYGVLGQLQQAADNATINVDATNQGIDMVMGFIFDELKNTNRTLIIKHQGSIYTIRGEPESADHLRMGGIALGNHHAFSILGDYRA